MDCSRSDARVCVFVVGGQCVVLCVRIVEL